MYAQVEKTKESKIRAVANSVTQKKSNAKQGFGFVDNRDKAIAQRQMSGIMNNCTEQQQKIMQIKGKVHVNDKKAPEISTDSLNKAEILPDRRLFAPNNTNPKHTMQMVWIQTGKNTYSWHATRDSVIWYYNEKHDTMYFAIKQFPKNLPVAAQEFYTTNRDKINTYEGWVKIMSEEFGSLVDEDDPVYEDPEFLVGEGSDDKILLLQDISKVLRANNIQVFLGGAASGALITETRKIKDLDLRVDGLERDIFNEKKYPNFFLKQIVDPLEKAGYSISNVEKAANTTMRFYIKDIEVSITSEPSSETTMTRGKMVTDIESLGEIDFILDKAAAAGDRDNINKLVTDVYDIIRVKMSMAGGGAGILNRLVSMRPKTKKKIIGLVSKLSQISNVKRTYKDENISKAREQLCLLMKIGQDALPKFLDPIILELKNQVEVTVI